MNDKVEDIRNHFPSAPKTCEWRQDEELMEKIVTEWYLHMKMFLHFTMKS